MGSIFRRVYEELKNLDRISGLAKKSLYISIRQEGDVVRWIDAPGIVDIDITKEGCLAMYRNMAFARALDEAIKKCAASGEAIGKHLLSSGNEAVAVGSACAMAEGDWMTLAIRDVGAMLARGVSAGKILSQACGKAHSPTGGWNGSLHLGDVERRILPLISHLPMVPVAAGCAFYETYTNGHGAVLAFCGDGATSTGDFHEALNIASVKRVPLVVVIENNQWAFGVPNCLQFAAPTLAHHSLSYGEYVEGYLIDGFNAFTVYDTVRKALQKARDDKVITIIEARTMRFYGHSLVDPYERYMFREELLRARERDPLKLCRETILAAGIAEESDIQNIEEQVAGDIRQAVADMRESPWPDASCIESVVFHSSPRHETEYREPPATAIQEKRFITYRQAIHEAMEREMSRVKHMCLFGQDIGVSGGAFRVTEGFSSLFDGINWDSWRNRPDHLAPPQLRVNDMPIAEAGMCGFGAGAAIRGLWVVIEMEYADFLTEAVKWIGNYMATQAVHGVGPMHIVIRAPSGWAKGAGPFHSLNPEALFASFPGLKIVAPITAFDAKGLFNAAIRDGNPVLYLEYKADYNRPQSHVPKELSLHVPEEDYVVPIGKARIVKPGNDCTVITWGSQMFRVLDAVHEVEAERKCSIEVIDLRSIVPFDKELLIESVTRTSRALVTCEAQETGCFGNTIVRFLQNEVFHELDAPVQLLAALDTPVPFSPPLEEAHLPTVSKLKTALLALLDF